MLRCLQLLAPPVYRPFHLLRDLAPVGGQFKNQGLGAPMQKSVAPSTAANRFPLIPSHKSNKDTTRAPGKCSSLRSRLTPISTLQPLVQPHFSRENIDTATAEFSFSVRGVGRTLTHAAQRNRRRKSSCRLIGPATDGSPHRPAANSQRRRSSSLIFVTANLTCHVSWTTLRESRRFIRVPAKSRIVSKPLRLYSEHFLALDPYRVWRCSHDVILERGEAPKFIHIFTLPVAVRRLVMARLAAGR
ncbi:hypothetical protein SCP_0603300 [Sparassis crispa]|uniref:Uncharacterized protein n=1 Tax=Sparassis crispa TaxID=139825 RepID=A0A401GQ74_9APHY|nr:hypothetical protein SCP_0603300 [Sparassis crispa]GBE84352.1 hypothetical protein SCP_0603300 [Sparassis crispa]